MNEGNIHPTTALLKESHTNGAPQNADDAIAFPHHETLDANKNEEQDRKSTNGANSSPPASAKKRRRRNKNQHRILPGESQDSGEDWRARSGAAKSGVPSKEKHRKRAPPRGPKQRNLNSNAATTLENQSDPAPPGVDLSALRIRR